MVETRFEQLSFTAESKHAQTNRYHRVITLSEGHGSEWTNLVEKLCFCAVNCIKSGLGG